jgi:Ca2+-binding RTX toxin-like protein
MSDPALEIQQAFLEAQQILNDFLAEQGQLPFQDPALAENFLIGVDIIGTDGNDTLTGTEGMDTISGLAGDDLLFGRQLDDVLRGNLGNDTLRGGIGFDSLFGGQGNDWLYGGEGDDEVNGNLGDDNLFGGPGGDRFVLSNGIDRIEDFNAAEGDKVLVYDFGSFLDYGNLVKYNEVADGVAITRYEPAVDSEGRFIRDQDGSIVRGGVLGVTTIVGADIYVWDPNIERTLQDPRFDPSLQIFSIGVEVFDYGGGLL